MKYKMKKINLLMAILFVWAAQSEASLIPPNDRYIPESMEMVLGGVDEATFNRVIDNVSNYYSQIVDAQGGQLRIDRLWRNGTVNASASRRGNVWIVKMYGGLARHSAVSEDSLTLVVCHELGHHLGGFPRAKSSDEDWASNEGQSDYFATMKCFRRVTQNEDHAAKIATLRVPNIVKEKCARAYRTQNESSLCIRGAMAGYDLAVLLADVGSESPPSFDTPDRNVVEETDDGHPRAQCRLDTYFAGAVCPVSFEVDFGQNDAVTGACSTENHDSEGYRRLCWYAPSASLDDDEWNYGKNKSARSRNEPVPQATRI